MSGQHTPGKRWKAWTDANITCEGIHGHVAECSTAERAREIVDALNAHDDLLAACKRALSTLGSLSPDGNDPYVMEAEAFIRAAISRAQSAGDQP